MDPVAVAPLISFGAFILTEVPFLIGLVMWSDVKPIKNRGVPIIIFNMVFFSIYYLLYSLEQYFINTPEYEGVSCYLTYWVSVLFLPLTITPYMLRAIRLYVLYTSGSLLVEQHRISLKLEEVPRVSFRHRIRVYVVSRLKWMAQSRGSLFTLVAVAVVNLVIGAFMLFIKADDFTIGANLCLNINSVYFVIVQAVILILLVIILLVFLFPVTDAYDFKTELSIIFVGGIITFTLWVLAIFNVILTQSVYFVFAFVWFCVFVSVAWPLFQAFRHYLQMNKINGSSSNASMSSLEKVTSDMGDQAEQDSTKQSVSMDLPTKPLNKKKKFVVIRTLMQDPGQFKKLLHASVECFSAETVLFCREVLVFQEAMLSQDPTKQRELAQSITDIYIREYSEREVNINDDVRATIINKVDHNAIEMDLFDDAEVEVLELVYTNILPHYRKKLPQAEEKGKRRQKFQTQMVEVARNTTV